MEQLLKDKINLVAIIIDNFKSVADCNNITLL
ncbi:hypothetical protein SAMN04488528_100364 [Clostridium frigidicarnis]|uniref:Uncharacterized protein n=1 Tax=Clostridium frigidicarnis TaxID=84698 RepID=A0A1I0VVM2_9CLOT|nr:hypothetical protein SAMN04488528_100364 [Clostridium frigidicarnis]